LIISFTPSPDEKWMERKEYLDKLLLFKEKRVIKVNGTEVKIENK
jgi:hypothetical protein